MDNENEETSEVEMATEGGYVHNGLMETEPFEAGQANVAMTEEDEKAEGLSLGAAGYVAKPINPEEVRSAIKKVLA